MYLLFIILPIFILLIIFNLWRRKKIIQKVCSLDIGEKCTLINGLLEPFGYCYYPSQDIFSSHVNAWQRELGYGTVYDKAAPHFHMIFDSLPIYFNYQGRTWLLELWKGQYGINTGGEIGLYYADRILSEDKLDSTMFQCVEDGDMVKMALALVRTDIAVAQLTEKHWWLTAFIPGCFSRPSDLALHASIIFPTHEMTDAFIRGLISAGADSQRIHRNCNAVSFPFDWSAPISGAFRSFRICLAQHANRFWCRVYLSVTKPFDLSLDRVLYLYFYLPFAFRKILRIRKYKKRRGA